jgi:hypothetical protein
LKSRAAEVFGKAFSKVSAAIKNFSAEVWGKIQNTQVYKDFMNLSIGMRIGLGALALAVAVPVLALAALPALAAATCTALVKGLQILSKDSKGGENPAETPASASASAPATDADADADADADVDADADADAATTDAEIPAAKPKNRSWLDSIA